MTTIRYTEDHEWIRFESDGTATVGITNHAQDSLGDIVFVELPEVGETAERAQTVCTVESVKAAADVKMPVSGTVSAVNTALVDDPATINSDPMGEGWFFRLSSTEGPDTEGLMDEAAYKALTGE